MRSAIKLTASLALSLLAIPFISTHVHAHGGGGFHRGGGGFRAGGGGGFHAGGGGFHAGGGGFHAGGGGFHAGGGGFHRGGGGPVHVGGGGPVHVGGGGGFHRGGGGFHRGPVFVGGGGPVAPGRVWGHSPLSPHLGGWHDHYGHRWGFYSGLGFSFLNGYYWYNNNPCYFGDDGLWHYYIIDNGNYLPGGATIVVPGSDVYVDSGEDYEIDSSADSCGGMSSASNDKEADLANQVNQFGAAYFVNGTITPALREEMEEFKAGHPELENADDDTLIQALFAELNSR